MYPKKVAQFIPWSKAMVAGATVDREYTKTLASRAGGKAMKRRRRKGRKRRKKAKDG